MSEQTCRCPCSAVLLPFYPQFTESLRNLTPASQGLLIPRESTKHLVLLWLPSNLFQLLVCAKALKPKITDHRLKNSRKSWRCGWDRGTQPQPSPNPPGNICSPNAQVPQKWHSSTQAPHLPISSYPRPLWVTYTGLLGEGGVDTGLGVRKSGFQARL